MSAEATAVPEPFEAAFESLFFRCGRVAYRLLGDQWAAEDVAGEAMARAYAHWPKISRLPHRDAWVLRVATNLAIDRGRRLARGAGVVGGAVEVELADVDAEAAVNELTILRVTLLDALTRLPRRQREILVLRHLTGLSEKEVADATGLSLGTVKTHLRRGLSALRRSLGTDGEEATDAG